jgi:hypothetical protein
MRLVIFPKLSPLAKYEFDNFKSVNYNILYGSKRDIY